LTSDLRLRRAQATRSASTAPNGATTPNGTSRSGAEKRRGGVGSPNANGRINLLRAAGVVKSTSRRLRLRVLCRSPGLPSVTSRDTSR
jgi:hypothetical protein